jgi:hypothetical protein
MAKDKPAWQKSFLEHMTDEVERLEAERKAAEEAERLAREREED